jgi:predicted RND superfamily exporter protein
MKQFSSRSLLQHLLNHRWAVVIIFALLTALFGALLTRIVVDNDTMKTVPSNLAEKQDYEQLQSLFAEPFTLLVIARFDDTDLSCKLDSLRSWAERFESLQIGDKPALTHTVHAAAVRIPQKGGFLGFKSALILPEGLSSEQLRQSISDNKVFLRTLISQDESVLGMVLMLNPEVTRTEAIGASVELVKQINALEGVQANITGASSIPFFLDKAMKNDFRILLPLGLALAGLLLYGIFRKWLYVALPILIIAIALVWTFGLMSLFGTPFSVITSMIPVILFPIGVADSIHLIKTFSRLRHGEQMSLLDALTKTFDELLRPVLLTSITTIIGFGSFAFSAISWTRHFGIFTALGVLFALLFTLILLPVLLSWESAPTGAQKKHKSSSTTHGGFMGWYRRVILESPLWIALAIVVGVACVIGSLKIRYESNPIGLFSPKSEVRQSDALIARYFGGTSFFSVVLTAPKGQLYTPQAWAQIDSISRYLQNQEIVGNVSSLLPLIQRTSTLLSGDTLSAGALSMLLGSGGMLGSKFSDAVNTWINESRTSTRLQLACKNIPGYKYTDFAARIRKHITTHFPGFTVLTAGQTLLIDSTATLLVKTQISSILMAFSTVFIILALLFRSIKIGLYTTIPIILSTVFTYASMGLFGVTINIATVIIVNTCMGIGIDYAIHFTAGYLSARRSTSSAMEAVLRTVAEKGLVIVFNTVVVGVGFLVLVLSSFPPIRHFGAFLFLAMVTSTIFSLVFLPVFFALDRTIAVKLTPAETQTPALAQAGAGASD